MQYYAALSGEIKDELVQKTDVDTLKEMDIQADTTIEQFAQELKQASEVDQSSRQDMEQERVHNSGIPCSLHNRLRIVLSSH